MNGFAFTVVLAVLVVMAASMTLLPAILGFAGRNIERLHVPFVSRDVRAYDASRWYRWSRFIQRRPWWAAIGSLAVLLALAAPFLGIRFGFPDAGNDPPSLHHPPGLRPARRRVRSRLRRTHAAHRPGRGRRRPACVRRRSGYSDWPRSTAWPTSSPAVVNAAGDTAVLTLTCPPRHPRTRRPRTWSTALRDDGHPRRHRGHRSDRRRRGRRCRQRRHHRGRRIDGCRSSSAACCSSRSSC